MPIRPLRPQPQGAVLEKISDETLMAYADGALDAAAAHRVENALLHDAQLQSRLAPFIVTRDALPELFSEALTSPVPDRLVDAVLSAPIGRQSQRAAETSLWASLNAHLRDLLFPQTPGFASGFALAAGVLAIAGAGWIAGQFAASRTGGPANAAIALNGDVPFAAGALHAALEGSASNAPVEEGSLKATPVLTFRDTAGHFCRQYTVTRSGEAPISGFACRTDQGRWSIAFHAPSGQGTAEAQEGYVPAGREEPAALEAAIDKSIAGDVMGKDDESRLIAQGWAKQASGKTN